MTFFGFWLWVILANIGFFLWEVRRVQPQSRRDFLVEQARDPKLREQGWVITGMKLRSKGWLGAVGEIYWRTPEGKKATGKVIW